MVATRVQNKSTEPQQLPPQFNRILKGKESVSYSATAADLIALCPTIEQGFTLTEFPNQTNGEPTPAMVSPTAASFSIAYVSTAGSDTRGNGSAANPWRTIAHAIRNAPKDWYSPIQALFTYQIRVIPPYSSAFGTITFPPAQMNSPVFLTARIQIIAWPSDGIFGATNDTRWTNVLGPLAIASPATYGPGRYVITLPALTLTADDQHVGQFVRIFNSAGVEVQRGWIFRTVLATQLLYFHPSVTYTPLTTDTIYICQPRVVLGATPVSASTLMALGGSASGVSVDIHTCRVTDAISLQGNINVRGTNTQFIANGGSGAINTRGPMAIMDGSVTSSITNLPTLENTLRITPCFFRGVTNGFLGSGNINLSGVWLGKYQSLGDASNRLNLSSCTFRGGVDGGVFGNISMYSFTTTTVPLLFIPVPSTTTGLVVASLNCKYIFDSTGFVNVETTLCGGDLFRIRNGGQIMCLATVRPVTATPMAAGLVMNATQDALGMINSASTIQGAGAVDVKAGGTGAVTFATLAGTRTSDAALFATVVAGTTV